MTEQFAEVEIGYDPFMVAVSALVGTVLSSTETIGSIFDGMNAVDLGGQLVGTRPVVAGPAGPPGEPGEPGETGPVGPDSFKWVEYQMPHAQTTAVIEHELRRDPIAVQVVVDGIVRDEYSVSFPLPGETVMLGFDESVQALIRLI